MWTELPFTVTGNLDDAAFPIGGNRMILVSLAEGDRVEDLLREFPTLSEDDVQAVIAFAAASAEEDLPVPAIPRAS